MALTFTRATIADASVISQLLEDPDARRRLSGFLPIDAFLAACAASGTMRAWMVHHDGRAIGFLSLEFDASLDCIWPAILISAQHGKRGYGRECLRFLRAQFPWKALRAEIEVDNNASMALAVSFGFKRTVEPATQGFVGLILPP